MLEYPIARLYADARVTRIYGGTSEVMKSDHRRSRWGSEPFTRIRELSKDHSPMQIKDINAVVTGGASGLGLATATRLIESGATVTLLDLPGSAGVEQAEALGPAARFVPTDVTDADAVAAAFAAAAERGPVRAVVHCAGRGKPMRILTKEGKAADLEPFESVIRLNVIGTFNVLRFAAETMAANETLDGDRGVCVLTASVAAFEGQIGQINYATAKAGVVGMTLPAARDLAGVGDPGVHDRARASSRRRCC